MLDRPHSSTDLAAYFAEEAKPRPARYCGQLTREFQASLVRHHENVREADCAFYHTIELPDGRILGGEWDLRGSEQAYLGEANLSGRRVLELGPASGALSAYMAAQGADLVILDLPFGSSPEIMPFSGIDEPQSIASGAADATRLRNSWWYTKRHLGFEASAVYADIYDPPHDIGRFEISVFGALLLHLSNPFLALRRAAAITDKTIIVTDVWSAPTVEGEISKLRESAPSLMVFGPTQPPNGLVHWWGLSPHVIRHMLERLGFGVTAVTTHRPRNGAPMFTVVGNRSL